LLGSISLMPKYLPLSDSAYEGFNYFKAFLPLPKIIFYTFFFNFSTVFAASYGATLDDKIIEFYRWLKNPSLDFGRNLCAKSLDLHGKYALMHFAFALFKFYGVVSTLIEIENEVESDYQSMKSLNDRIISETSTGLPIWFFYFSAWLEFAHNQINDPVMIITNISMLTTLVYLMEAKLFAKWRKQDEEKAALPSSPLQEKSLFSRRKSALDDLEVGLLSEKELMSRKSRSASFSH
jgi:hypothetical protein